MKPFIVANWKCNPTSLAKAKRLFSSIKRGIKRVRKVKIVICPPFTYLSCLKSRSSIFQVGAQDIFWKEKGAFTGEISPGMLKDLGCKYVIVGHSERRRYLAETNEAISKKIKIALSYKLTPILCVGESQKDKERGKSRTILDFQISKALKGIAKKKIKNIIIAYEPIWAIGSGRPCDVNTAWTQNLLIRKIIKKISSVSTSKSIRILYGGSVNAKNATSYIKEAKMNGLLVGGASLKAKEFIQIIKKVAES